MHVISAPAVGSVAFLGSAEQGAAAGGQVPPRREQGGGRQEPFRGDQRGIFDPLRWFSPLFFLIEGISPWPHAHLFPVCKLQVSVAPEE
jgi:hypothetical protein